MTSIMEEPAMMENGNAPQNRKSTCLRGAFYALIFVLIIISALIPIVFCLLHHKQAPESCWAHASLEESSKQNSKHMNWKWKLENCNGIVQGQEKYLIIEQSGNYFIYAQLYRKKKIEESFTLTLFKESPKMSLNKAVGHDNGTVNFARGFSLKKGDKLYCEKNDDLDNVLVTNETYWGLFQM